MRELLITTGHNSSAILIEDGQVQWGYETERVTGVKSDSRFPLEHIEHWGQSIGKIDLAYVTHWSPDGQLSSMSTKHWDPTKFLEGVPIHTLDPMAGRSHHDTHIHAALSYANSGYRRFPTKDTYGIVIDGFGNLGEHFSVYNLSSGKPYLVKRIHGYDTSLGLWYQYATAFMGMKMHEDEYKLLGYEAHCPANRQDEVIRLAKITAHKWLDDMSKSIYGSKYDPLYNVNALGPVKNRVFDVLSKACTDLQIADVSSFDGRALLAAYVQTVLEMVVMEIVHEFRPTNLLLSGGVFYNVKLNKVLMESVKGQTCVYPLAGDQGNALGLYSMANPDFTFPDHLCWGKRVLRDVGHVEGLVTGNTDQIFDYAVHQLKTVGYVNLVRGNMEFGPRALCNTSTLALPTSDNVRRINAMNERNTVMPMAPAMTLRKYRELFDRIDHVWRSHHHMIIAMEYIFPPIDSLKGVVHKYSWPYVHYTGRPQVVPNTDVFMHALLEEFEGVLINTSFNFHGKPIALGMDSVVMNHMEEYRRDDTIRTAVITSE